jgi:hypothetical protein
MMRELFSRRGRKGVAHGDEKKARITALRDVSDADPTPALIRCRVEINDHSGARWHYNGSSGFLISIFGLNSELPPPEYKNGPWKEKAGK